MSKIKCSTCLESSLKGIPVPKACRSCHNFSNWKQKALSFDTLKTRVNVYLYTSYPDGEIIATFTTPHMPSTMWTLRAKKTINITFNKKDFLSKEKIDGEEEKANPVL